MARYIESILITVCQNGSLYRVYVNNYARMARYIESILKLRARMAHYIESILITVPEWLAV